MSKHCHTFDVCFLDLGGRDVGVAPEPEGPASEPPAPISDGPERSK